MNRIINILLVEDDQLDIIDIKRELDKININISKMKKSIFSVALLIVTLTACQNNSKPENQNDVSVQDTLARHEDEHNQQPIPVTLNKGEKWTANKETTEGINKMALLISGLPPVPKPGDYRSLKTNLETEFNLIVQKCTMTGEAHEQLHRYLVPMTVLFKKLDSEDMDVCNRTIVELKQHLTEYGAFFQ